MLICCVCPFPFFVFFLLLLLPVFLFPFAFYKVLCDAYEGIQPYHLCSHLCHVLLPFELEIIENSFTKVGDIRDTVKRTYDQIWNNLQILKLIREVCDTVERHTTKYGFPLKSTLVWGSLRLAPITSKAKFLVVHNE